MPDLTRDLEATQGGRYRCPWCDARRGLSLAPDQGESGLFHCFACHIGGDGVELYVKVRDADVSDALEAFGIDRSGEAPASARVKRKETRAPRPTVPDYSDAEWKQRTRAWKAMNCEEVRLRAAYKRRRAGAREKRDREAFDRWQAKLDDLHEHVLRRERAGHRNAQRLDAKTDC